MKLKTIYKKIIKLLLFFLIITVPTIGGTNSYFYDQAAITGNTLSTGYWVPGTPTGLTILNYLNQNIGCGGITTSPQITLDWDDNTDEDLAFYEIQKEEGGDINQVNDSVFNENLIIEGFHQYRVRAVDTGGYQSDWSSWCGVNFDPTPVINPGDIVINEVMWAGSSVSDKDEWIELRNMRGHDIDISGFMLKGAVAGKSGHLQIPHGYVIPAGGYFLIGNFDTDNKRTALAVEINLRSTSLNLDDDYGKNGQLILLSPDRLVIDRTPLPGGEDWPNGGYFISMQRILDPHDGTDIDEWVPCLDSDCTSDSYWLKADGNFGTPGSQNLIPDNIEASSSIENNLLSLSLSPVCPAATGKYLVSYSRNGLPEEVGGAFPPTTYNHQLTTAIQLATCSGENCAFHQNIQNLNISIEGSSCGRIFRLAE